MPGPQLTRNRVLSTKLRAAHVRPLRAYKGEPYHVYSDYRTYEKYGASYKTLTLTDGEYAFTVTPEKGGMATSFTKTATNTCGCATKTSSPRIARACGIPILFPNCGKPDDGVHHFNGAAIPSRSTAWPTSCRGRSRARTTPPLS